MRRFALWAVFAIAGTTACASHHAPPGYLPSPTDSGSDVYGAWIDLECRAERLTRRVSGELLAASPDSLWILTATGVEVVPGPSILEGRLVRYDPQVGRVAGLTFLGTLSTISNGFLLLATAPMWIIGGSLAASGQSREPIEDVPAVPCWQLAQYARFPQGVPPGIKLHDLRRKQY